jgi:CheY-like chemotaxis protein
VHEIGIQFEHEIDPEDILIPSDLEEVEETTKLDESMGIPSLDGRVLVVDDSDSDRRLFVHQLQSTGLEIDAVETPGKAMDAIKRRAYDIVVVGLDLARGDGVRVVQQVRAIGHRRPILVFTAEFNSSVLARVRAAGVNEIVGKPYDPFYVMYLLCESLDQPAPDNAVHSRFNDEPEMTGLLAEFVAEMRLLGRRLAKAAKDGDLPVVRELCVRMAGSGTNHGFDHLSVAARDAVRDLDSAGDLAPAMPVLRRVISICERLRVREPRRSA